MRYKKIIGVIISIFIFLLVKGIRYEVSRNIRENKRKEKELIHAKLSNTFMNITREKAYQIRKEAFDTDKDLNEKLKEIDEKLKNINEEYFKKLKETKINENLSNGGTIRYIATQEDIEKYMQYINKESLKNIGYGFSYLQEGLKQKDINKIETGEKFFKNLKLEEDSKKNIEDYTGLLKELIKELSNGYIIKENINIYYEYYKAFTEKEKNSYPNFNLNDYYHNQKDLSFYEKIAYLKLDKYIKEWIFIYELDKWGEKYIPKSMISFSDDVNIEVGRLENKDNYPYFEESYIKIILNSDSSNELKKIFYTLRSGSENKIEIKIKDKIYKFFTRDIKRKNDLIIIKFSFKSSREKEFLKSLSEFSKISMLINNDILIKFNFANNDFLKKIEKLQ